MNIFCYPQITSHPQIVGALGTSPTDIPEFGFKPRTPLSSGRSDNTEIDMKLGSLLIEAKLTESDFQVAHPRLVQRYRDFDTIFKTSELPMRNGKHLGYQLIRGTLAAYAMNCCFCVICDARRPDLIEVWFKVLRAVLPCHLRCNLKLLTWQELADSLPPELQAFLASKYGIAPRTA